jgi:endonuclease/exonuclease/phosphatase (EEP) superfamily protein YafD
LAARHPVKLSFKLAAAAAIALAALCGIGVYLGRHSPVLDFFGQFALQAAIAAGLLGALLLAWRAWRLAAASFIAAVLAFGAMAPHTAVPPCQGPAPHRVVFLNVWGYNPDIAEVAHYLERTNADAVVLAEVRPRFKSALAPLRKLYPYHVQQCSHLRAGCGLIAFSRVPVALQAGGAHVPSMIGVMTLHFPEGNLALAGVHLPHAWPLGSEGYQRRTVAAIERTLKHTPGPKLVVGDFNAATWSSVVGRIAHAGGLSALSSHGTWRTNLPWPLRIPIDQALVSPNLRCATKGVSGRLSSDHRAISVDFALEPARQARAR